MFRLLVDDSSEGVFETREEAYEARIAAVRNWLNDLYQSDSIDKYAVEDWMSGVKACDEDEYYVDEFCGCSFDVREIDPIENEMLEAISTLSLADMVMAESHRITKTELLQLVRELSSLLTEENAGSIINNLIEWQEW